MTELESAAGVTSGQYMTALASPARCLAPRSGLAAAQIAGAAAALLEVNRLPVRAFLVDAVGVPDVERAGMLDDLAFNDVDAEPRCRRQRDAAVDHLGGGRDDLVAADPVK